MAILDDFNKENVVVKSNGIGGIGGSDGNQESQASLVSYFSKKCSIRHVKREEGTYVSLHSSFLIFFFYFI